MAHAASTFVRRGFADALRHHQAGRLDEAIEAYSGLLRRGADLPELHFNLGVALGRRGRLDEAVACYRSALDLKPDYLAAQNNLGNTLKALGRLDEAITCYGALRDLAPGAPQAHFNLANALRSRGRLDEAVASYRAALALDPAGLEALINLGLAQLALGKDEDALASFDRALAIKPDYAAAWCNRGTALANLGREADERETYRRALALLPDDPTLRWEEAARKLLHGDYAAGWPEYEWRWRMPAMAPYLREPGKPIWTGEQDVAGSTILLHAEQGFGDTIQFCRYAPAVARRGARVILEAPVPLVSLLSRMDRAVRVLPFGDTLPAFDMHCPLLSLPRAFGTHVDTIPAETPYLRPCAELVASWRARFSSGVTPRVGIAWAGSAGHKNDHNRSIPFALFARLVVPNITFISLQNEIRPADAAALARYPEIRLHADELCDFDQTAALLATVDLVITVDTSVAHLAGALGCPVWLLLPFRPDFRWLLKREDSPWYPSMRLLRQPARGDWEPVLARARDDLVAWGAAAEKGVGHARS